MAVRPPYEGWGGNSTHDRRTPRWGRQTEASLLLDDYQHGRTHMIFEEAKRRYPISETEEGCWVWTGSRSRNGYGCLFLGNRLQFAHRHVFREAHGSIPARAHLDHRCRNRACVNPEHLEPVTSRENTRRGRGPSAANAAKTHCLRGHPFDLANTRQRSDGRRICRACARSAGRNMQVE